MKYKIKITKAYLITIEDKDGYEVASDWSFLDYKETKKIAEKMLADLPTIDIVHCKDCIYRQIREGDYLCDAHEDTEQPFRVKADGFCDLGKRE